ncbi:ABC transporter ATP-binding protein [Psychrobium sp. 1_MG-2023]|uniref:ATP-binding cassette ATPase Uup n=1 Tax=Psychrobium sp. 1_MG-2023 TaxID=3062624 RepID=UPI000C348147|nr:ABC transporter ATP-binding protein [Psychrobium sp. 1_MG-2023]MDP2560351.1 ABC transporter ATP-binding protein [Psychrobium sp. 1_MG-2023]PKF55460.1 ABC transporter ATP-binding protein [Alteromonadales bacterium alter-6D02]
MMLIRLNNAQLAFGTHVILDHADIQVNANERVCLVGKNGTGKSTLMKVIAKQMDLDGGDLHYNADIVVARLEQDPPEKAQMSVFDFVASGLAHVGELIKDYHHVVLELETNYSDDVMARLEKLQAKMDDNEAWLFETRINQVLEQLSLPADKQLSELSGGWLRKAALAKALVQQPDVLLLDEPTNHLDLNAIGWLEKVLLDFRGAIVFISHDRAFIRKMATRIIDLDRGKLSSWPGTYADYLTAKEESLRVEAEQNALFDKKLAQEETWVRQGIKARRTRNEGRVRALEQLRRERTARREVVGKAKMSLASTSKSGKLVFEVDNISYQYEAKPIVTDFTTRVIRGDRIALIGPNGCGKSTLLKLLLSQLEPKQGEIKTGTLLDVAYFDQHRAALDLDKTVQENVGDGKDDVMHNGRSRHVLGYLQDFLFSPKRARTPVRALSGGEKNRLLLAKLFLKPNNMLVLDEPTNDLDIETLELLESLVHAYQGTLLLVSHDREFINNTVTSSWWFGANGHIEEFVGGFDDATAQGASLFDPESYKPEATSVAEVKVEPVVEEKVKSAAKKLSYKDQRELDLLPEKMESLEQQIEQLQTQMSDPEFFAQAGSVTEPVIEALKTAEQELEYCFERWELLDS